MGPGHFSKCSNEKDVITCRRKKYKCKKKCIRSYLKLICTGMSVVIVAIVIEREKFMAF